MLAVAEDHCAEWIALRVAALPEREIKILAKGPVDEPRCRLCMLTRLEADTRQRMTAAAEAATQLLDYHAHRKGTEFEEGEEATIYARCLAVYRAAGWTG